MDFLPAVLGSPLWTLGLDETTIRSRLSLNTGALSWPGQRGNSDHRVSRKKSQLFHLRARAHPKHVYSFYPTEKVCFSRKRRESQRNYATTFTQRTPIHRTQSHLPERPPSSLQQNPSPTHSKNHMQHPTRTQPSQAQSVPLPLPLSPRTALTAIPPTSHLHIQKYLTQVTRTTHPLPTTRPLPTHYPLPTN